MPTVGNTSATGVAACAIVAPSCSATTRCFGQPDGGLAVTGLTHKQAYMDIFAITLIKTAAVFVVIGVFHATGWI